MLCYEARSEIESSELGSDIGYVFGGGSYTLTLSTLSRGLSNSGRPSLLGTWLGGVEN